MKRRREWLLLAAVLVPFGALLATSLCADDASTTPPGPRVASPAAPTHAVDTPTRPPAPHDAPPRPAATPAEARPPQHVDTPTTPAHVEGLDPPPGLEAAFEALQPALRQCAEDITNAPTPVEVHVRFKATREGRFTGYRLETRSWQDPYLEACLEDVFDEVSWAATGGEPTGDVERTLTLHPPGR